MPPRRRNPLVCSIFRVHHLFHILLVLAGQATCRPTRVPSNIDRKDLHQDQHGLRETEVVYMVQNVSVLQNVVPECCTLTFIPVSFPDGNPAVKIVTSCTMKNTAEDPGGSCGMNGTPGNQSTVAASGTSTLAPMSTNMTQITVLSTGISTISSSASISLSLTTLSTPTPTYTTPPSSFTSSAPSTTPTLSPPLSSSNTFSSQPNAVTPTTAASNVSTSISSDVVTSTSPAKVAAAISSRTASTLPKVIGGLAGVAVGLLIIAGTIGYVKQKRMKKDEAREIQWPS